MDLHKVRPKIFPKSLLEAFNAIVGKYILLNASVVGLKVLAIIFLDVQFLDQQRLKLYDLFRSLYLFRPHVLTPIIEELIIGVEFVLCEVFIEEFGILLDYIVLDTMLLLS